MLHDIMHILALAAKNEYDGECLSCYLYKKQHESLDFSVNFRPKVDNMDKYGREIADELEKSIQKAIDNKR